MEVLNSAIGEVDAFLKKYRRYEKAIVLRSLVTNARDAAEVEANTAREQTQTNDQSSTGSSGGSLGLRIQWLPPERRLENILFKKLMLATHYEETGIPGDSAKAMTLYEEVAKTDPGDNEQAKVTISLAKEAIETIEAMKRP